VSDDDLVRRVTQREKAAREEELARQFAAHRNRRDAAYRLLTDIRRNLAAFVSSAEDLLELISIRQYVHPATGKTHRLRSAKTSAGWLLYAEWVSEGPTYRHYLTHDGRMVKDDTLLSDRSFMDSLYSLPHGELSHLQESINTLYERAGLPRPEFPGPTPPYSPDGYSIWKAVLAEQSPTARPARWARRRRR
jgi:hypothetical protein